ncbi:MAG: hypothetical protein AAB486_02585 [Patescibacteria group bacterium]
MLRYRICAHCGSTIESPTACFCYHCGLALEQTPDNSFPVKTPPLVVSVTSVFSLRGRLFFFLLLILVFSIAGTGFYWFRSGSFRASKLPSGRPENAVLLQNFHFAAPDLPWAKLSLAELVPDTADSAVFGRSFADFVSKIIPEGQSLKFQKITGLTLAEAQTYLEPDFAFFKSGSSSAFLGKIKAKSFVEQKVDEVKNSLETQGFSPLIIGEYLLVTDSPELAQLTVQTQAKKHLNLSLTTPFSEAWRRLPHQGQFFFFAASHDNLGQLLTTVFGPDIGGKLSGKIRGQALVVTPVSSGTLLQGTIDGK